MQEKINHYLAEGFTKVVEGDGSAFDNTQDVSLKELDRKIYQRIIDKVYHVPKNEFEQISQQLIKEMNIEEVKNGRRKVLIHYKVLGTVFSGDCDTTLMNTIRMAMYNRYVNDKAGLIYGKDYVCFSKGDDFTVMYKPYVKDNFINKLYYRYFLEANPDPSKPDTRIGGLGQVLKFLEIGDASIIKFCSLRAWWKDFAETQIYLTRDPEKLYNLGKYTRKGKNYNLKELVQYLEDQAVALEKSYPKIKLFMYYAQQYRNRAAELLQKFKISRNEYNKYILRKMQREINRENIFIKSNTYRNVLNYLYKLEELEKLNVKHMKDINKIQGDLHEYYKQLMHQQEDELTENQAKYINLQILSEFSIEYLKSMIDVGPRNKTN